MKPSDFLPLSPVELAVLVLLEERGAAYGYGIVKGIAERSMGEVRLAPGNLYQVLDRLLDRGWITEADPEEAGDGRRRYYAVTAAGRTAAAAEAARLRALLRTIDRLDLAATRGKS